MKKTVRWNFRIRADLAGQYTSAAAALNRSRTGLFEDVIRALDDLVKRAAGRTVITLEFKGYETTHYPEQHEEGRAVPEKKP